MILNTNIVHGTFYGQGEVIKLLENGNYYNKYSFKNDGGDKFLLYVNKEIIISENTIVSINAEYKQPTKQRNKGGFDYSKYMYSQNYYGSIFVDKSNEIEIIDENKFNLISKIQNSIFKVLNSLLPKEQMGILLGMIIGDTFYISDEIEEAFKLSGITHLLAVSGSNVTYVVCITKFLFDKIMGKHISNYCSIIMIILFVLISGASPSVARAGVMAIILILSEIMSRAPNTFSTIASTAFFILLYNPLIICDVGFLLSFGGTIGIVLFNKVFLEYIQFKFPYLANNSLIKYFLELLTVTISAQIILLPIMWYYFNTISLITLITNLLIGPFVGSITILGIAMFFLSLIYRPIGKMFSYTVYLLISLIIYISKFCSKIPYANLTLPTPSILMIVTYYLVLYILLLKIKKSLNYANKEQFNLQLAKTKIVKVLVYVLIFVQIAIFFYPKNFIEVSFIDVGQGDCTLIHTNNFNILIDGGGSENSDYDVGEKVLVPYLLDNTNGVIDMMIISHFHEDHVEGCISVLEALKVNKIIIGAQPVITELYEKVLKIAKQKDIPIYTVKKGNRISIGDIYFDIIYPDENIEIQDDLNNNSLVMKMVYKDVSIMFTGDMEKDAEKEIVDSLNKSTNINDISNLRSNILKVAHHGSKTSSTSEFLHMVSPQISIISVGVDNKFNHPHREVLDRLEEISSKILRIDECGKITLKIYKTGKVRINTKIKSGINA